MTAVAATPRIMDGAAKPAEFLSIFGAGIGAPITEKEQKSAEKNNTELQLNKEVCIAMLCAPFITTYLRTHRPAIIISS